MKKRKIWKEYWEAYGGFKSLISSIYFKFSLIVTLMMTPYWLNNKWWELIIDIAPNIIGFSLGGYAIFLAFGDSEPIRRLFKIKAKNKEVNSDDETNHSLFIGVSASFLHFILSQIIALLLALISMSLFIPIPEIVLDVTYFFNKSISLLIIEISRIILWGISFFIFIYSIFLAIAASMAIFRLSRWLELLVEDEEEKSINNDNETT